MRIVPPGVVPHPVIVLRVNVRRRRMPGLILVSPSLLALLLRLPLRRFHDWSPRWRRPVLRNVPATNALLMSALLLWPGAVWLLRSLLFWLTSLLLGPFLCQQSLRKTHHTYHQQCAK